MFYCFTGVVALSAYMRLLRLSHGIYEGWATVLPEF